MQQSIIAIPKNFTHGDDLLLIRRTEYEKLQKKASEIDEIMETIKAGEKEIASGKVKYTRKSISEALKR